MRLSANRQRQGGQALVELAFMLPVLTLLLLGILYFGFAFYTYNKLDRNIHEAGRYACSRTLLNSTDGQNAYRTQVRNIVLYGNPAGSGTAVVPGLAANNIEVAFLYDGTPTSTSRPARVLVRVTTYTMPGTFRVITITNKPWVIFPYLGQFNPI